jgi:hypothetical protein
MVFFQEWLGVDRARFDLIPWYNGVFGGSVVFTVAGGSVMSTVMVFFQEWLGAVWARLSLKSCYNGVFSCSVIVTVVLVALVSFGGGGFGDTVGFEGFGVASTRVKVTQARALGPLI